MNNKLRIIHSLSFDPWYNLGLEEYFFENPASDEVILYLWQNEKAVVIGQNQNAWKECRCNLLYEKGGKLARRLSGGGAVYHDLGNLNFSFITKDNNYDLEKQLSVILKAVNSFGIKAHFSGRNDIVVNEKKFSGNAFYFDKGTALHHGTILINTDLLELVNYLKVSESKIRSKGIDSVSSRVINLTDIDPVFTVDSMKNALIKSFQIIYDKEAEQISVDPEIESKLKDLYSKYASWEWRFGKSLDFDISFSHRFDWGEFDLILKMKQAYIDSAHVFSDSMEVNLIKNISAVVNNGSFKLEDICRVIESIAIDEGNRLQVEELTKWIRKEIRNLT